MSFVQVKDALQRIRKLYRSFVSELERLPLNGVQADFVERLVQAEKRMESAVATALNADEVVLDGWLQFFPDRDLTLPQINSQPLSMDDLLATYSVFNHELVELFELVRRSTECAATREIFDQLATVERQNARDLAWAGRHSQ